MKVSARQAGSEHGLQPVQLEVLGYLSVCNQFSDTPMAVTRYLGQTKGTVSQTIKVLERKGLVLKESDINDRRITHIKVTEQGSKLFQDNIPPKMFVNACQDLSYIQQKEIEASLKLLLMSFIKSNNMKSFGTCNSCRYNEKISDDSFYCKLVKVPLTLSDIALICIEHENIG
ncbi:MarR family winged helix-turn-helix transcriptional regulator [Pseudoalteromonas sp. NBT06-2]|uniref:MarR family winged helix-turn-helix transcriptional regulator n=1 Tax=Pseudoalteromonas sp. NBT06-2 TaxID=2025950 RepID=UPI001BB010EA|nr:MarR family winged helix-turn-helix transcriptional regulator [Pseudoalteromonas sp. NBT06-2]